MIGKQENGTNILIHMWQPLMILMAWVESQDHLDSTNGQRDTVWIQIKDPYGLELWRNE